MGNRSKARQMCMEEAEAKEPHAPAAAASHCYCWVQNSFLWCRKALMRGSYEVLYRQHVHLPPQDGVWYSMQQDSCCRRL